MLKVDKVRELPLIPVSQSTLFPGMIVPLIIPDGKLSACIDQALASDGIVGVLLTRNASKEDVALGPATSFTGMPAAGAVDTLDTDSKTTTSEKKVKPEFFRFGVAGKILKRINLPENQVSVLINGVQRFEIVEHLKSDPTYVARVRLLDDIADKDSETEALVRSALSQFKQVSKDNPLISEEVKVALVNIDTPAKLVDFMSSVLVREVEEYQRLLGISSVKERLREILLLLKKEQDVQNVQKKIQDEINQKVNSAQKEFYLNEQMKQIQKELGRYTDERARLTQKFKDRLKGRKIPTAVQETLDEEFEKLGSLNEQSAEYGVSVNYIDWLTNVPWGVRSDDPLSLKRAKQILDEDHYGLKDVKNRILEALAVRKLKNRSEEGTILCFVGPPGTGKTSLGRSIARAMGKKFYRFSVGGMRDEAEIKGHRRTYVGAMPGKVVQGLKRVGVQNPVFLIDEIDKIGSSYANGGDPASALLELLDPEQNNEFTDHYLDVPLNCSEIFFITTANSTDTIPDALLDRMEVIELHGYTDSEKKNIARKYLLPKQLKKNALKAGNVKFTDTGLNALIHGYARESGVRSLEKYIEKICRKVAYRKAMGQGLPLVVPNEKVLEKFLGPAPFRPENRDADKVPGVATGLAWTPYGGDVLKIESAMVDSRGGGLALTGTLGKVMQESANIAFTWVRENAKPLRLTKNFFGKHQIHVHVPAGATPKDGPSAGITMAASLYSLLSQKPLRSGVAMTGELTLTGRVLPVGGIQEKLLAAQRNGLKTILLPHENDKDLKEVASEVKAGLKIHRVRTMQDCLRHLF